ncbi:hypothetical protein [Roseinatronobacter sp. S2]|uniref:hypothetical protein n=1 Tax=Roseinatronobacter sp. S2 TaxID=3035471 RepID=UPI00240F6530|nr:hypothetical protein [Roseinatronobacter sp. S2]WFE73543.1 hypothetical protein P8S53_10110 [Roseinatronobacter sp. S2]
MTQTNKRRLLCIATRRSGHHAFLEWVLAGAKQPWTYYNNVNVTRAHFAAARALRQDGRDAAASPEGDHVDTPLLAFSVEDRTLDQVLNWSQVSRCLPPDARVDIILFLRDPLNAFASLLQVLDRAGWVAEDENRKARRRAHHLRSWASLAREFLAETDQLSRHAAHWRVHRVHYNGFIGGMAARDDIAAALDLQPTQLQTGLSRFGGGGNTFFSDKAGYSLSPDTLEARWQQVDAPARSVLRDELLDGPYADLVARFYSAIGRQQLLQDARSALA